MDRLSFMVGLRVGLALGRGGEFGIRNAEFEIAGDGAAVGEAPSVSLAADSSLGEGAAPSVGSADSSLGEGADTLSQSAADSSLGEGADTSNQP